MVRFYQSRSLRPLPGNPLPTAAALLLLVILASVAEAQPPVPQLDELHPCVGRGGSEFELRVTGANLDGAERLLFSHAQIVATQKTRPASEFVEFPGREPSVFLVRIPETVSGGTYSVRVAGRFGISNPRQFQVVQGELHHDSPATTFDNAPTALADHFYTARMNASAVHYFRYALQA